MWHFVVCDDEDISRQVIVEKFRMILDELQIKPDQYDITEYSSLARLKKRATAPSLLLLDVVFTNEERGTQAAAQMRDFWPNTPVIYISSVDDYVWESFDAYFVSYVRKKEIGEKLEPAVMRALEEIRQLNDPIQEIPFSLARGEEPYWIPVKDIYYIRAAGHKMDIYIREAQRYPTNPLSYHATFQKEVQRLKPYHLYFV